MDNAIQALVGNLLSISTLVMTKPSFLKRCIIHPTTGGLIHIWNETTSDYSAFFKELQQLFPH